MLNSDFIDTDQQKLGIATGNQELLIRRKGKSIPADLTAREQVERISWVDTVLLNLVLQIAFRLSVTISRQVNLNVERPCFLNLSLRRGKSFLLHNLFLTNPMETAMRLEYHFNMGYESLWPP